MAVVAALNVALGLAYYLRWAGLLVSPRRALAPGPEAEPGTGRVTEPVTVPVTGRVTVPAAAEGAEPVAARGTEPVAAGVAAVADRPLRWRVRPAEGLALGGAAAGCAALSIYGQAIATLASGVLR